MQADPIQAFVTLWVVVDPLGTLPVLMALATGMSAADRHRLAIEAVVVAFGVLAVFCLFGGAVLRGLDISVESFRIAGGMVLFLFALTLIFGESKHERDLASAGSIAQSAVFPLAMPSLASPGAMLTVTLLAEEDQRSVGILWTLGLLAGVMLTALAILLLSGPLHRVIGDAGAAVISRVMGMILAAIAVNEVLLGFVHIGALAPF